MKEEDFTKILELEEEFVRKMCDEIIAVKPTLVITEKGVSDLAQHFLMKQGISCIRRVKKSDNNRIARCVCVCVCVCACACACMHTFVFVRVYHYLCVLFALVRAHVVSNDPMKLQNSINPIFFPFCTEL